MEEVEREEREGREEEGEEKEEGRVRGKVKRERRVVAGVKRWDGVIMVGVAGRKLEMADGVIGQRAGFQQQTWTPEVKNGLKERGGQARLGPRGDHSRICLITGASHLAGVKWKAWVGAEERAREEKVERAVKEERVEKEERVKKRKKRNVRRGRDVAAVKGAKVARRSAVAEERADGDGQNHISSS